MSCERCLNPSNISRMSIFNTQMICLDCQTKEEAHPDYDNAKKEELDAVRNGNYNFPGVGLPKNYDETK